jgi:hypothetical protein
MKGPQVVSYDCTVIAADFFYRSSDLSMNSMNSDKNVHALGIHLYFLGIAVVSFRS